MRKSMLMGATGVAFGLILTLPGLAAPTTGATAPTFTAIAADGQPVDLAKLRGKTVVLEWNNPGCPFVQKHYRSGNMQRTQAAAAKDGVVWLSINSGAPGQQGHMSPAQAKDFVATSNATQADYVLDPKGVIGRMYDAKTTPQMFVIDKGGKLVYQGAIDDKPTANVADIKTARNHVLAALAEVKAGKKVSVAETRPYGCAVKYAA